MTLSITKAPADGSADKDILRLHEVCWPGGTPYPVEGSHWWLARDESGKAVAFGGIAVSVKEGGGYLCRAGVHPSARGQGLQVRLIKLRESFARRMDLNFLITDTIQNPVSANHLIGCGFRLFDPLTPWASDESLYWRKELA